MLNHTYYLFVCNRANFLKKKLFMVSFENWPIQNTDTSKEITDIFNKFRETA